MQFLFMLLLLGACASSGTNTIPITPQQGARLMASRRFDIVEEPQRADAVLTGAAALMQHGARHYRGIGIFRIVENRTGETVWSYEYKRGFMLGGSVSSRMADQVVDQLLQVAGPARS